MPANTYLTIALVFSLLVAILGSIVHFISYAKLYDSLKLRGLVGPAYKPGWAHTGSWGCMNLISKIKETIRTEMLTKKEIGLMRTAVIAYYAGIPFVVTFVLWVLWTLYTFAK